VGARASRAAKPLGLAAGPLGLRATTACCQIGSTLVHRRDVQSQDRGIFSDLDKAHSPAAGFHLCHRRMKPSQPPGQPIGEIPLGEACLKARGHQDGDHGIVGTGSNAL